MISNFLSFSLFKTIKMGAISPVKPVIRRRGFRDVIFLLAVAPVWAFGATYYVDQTGGNDTRNGTSSSTAWKNCPGMSAFAGSGTLAPGDTVYFDRADIWPVNGAQG